MDEARLKSAVQAGRIGEVLDAFERATEIRQRRFLREGLRCAIEQADPGSLGQGDHQRLLQHGWAREELEPLMRPPPSSAVHVPLVALHDGTEAASQGLCRLMMVRYDPNHSIRDRYDAAARAAVDDGLRAGANVLGQSPFEGYTFLPVQQRMLGTLCIAGSSLGAAAAVSAASFWSRRRVEPGTAVTGRIAGARVVSTGGLEGKVAALVGRPDIRRLVVPMEDAAVATALAADCGLPAEVTGVSTVGELVEVCLEAEARPEADPDEAVRQAREAYGRGWQGWHWPTLLEQLERLTIQLPRRRPDLLVRALTMLAAAHRNQGDPAEALERLEEALAILDTDEAELGVPDDERTFLFRHRSVTLQRLCRFDEALDAARDAEEHARRGRLRRELAFALGVRGLVHLSLGQPHEAVGSQEEALGHVRKHSESYAPRTVSYLVQALGCAGQPEEARRRYEEGLAILARMDDPPRRLTDERWLRTYLAEGLRHPEHAAERRALLEVPAMRDAIERQPMPGLLARRWLGLAEVELGERRIGYARLAASPAAHPHAGQPHVRFLAHLNVLYEGWARARQSDLDDDAVRRVELALRNLPETDAAADFLSPPAERVFAALAGGDGSDLAKALEPLLEACGRLG